jgi:hypothetical protein
MAKVWKKGRGKLGFLQPLLGRWVAEADTPMGPVRCTRVFELVLNGSYMQLTARWEFGAPTTNAGAEGDRANSLAGKAYAEIALIGADGKGQVCFWSFTSDGKRSEGTVADVSDIHAEAIGFEAQMPAGLARMAYWPDSAGGYFWAVESKNAKGWRRFTEHHYRPASLECGA